jgi:hypothetical protein
MLSEVVGQQECESEDLIGEAVILPALTDLLGQKLTLNQADRSAGSLVDQIKAAAQRHGIDLPDGWKPELARRLVVAWSTQDPNTLPADMLDRAEALFKALNERFAAATV